MYRQQFYIVANFLMAVDAIVLIVTAYVAYSISLEVGAQGLPAIPWYEFLGGVLFLVFANNYLMGKAGFYSPRRFAFPSTWSMIGALFMVVSLDFIVFSTVVIVIRHNPFSRVFLVAHFLSALIALIMTRLILYYYLDRRARTSFNSRQILLVGSNARIMAVAKALDKQLSWGHQVAGSLKVGDEGNPVTSNVPVLGTMDDFDEILRERQIDEVIFALPKGYTFDLEKYMEKCKRIGVTTRIVPSLYVPAERDLKVETVQHIPTLTHGASFATASGLLYKKILDLVVGLFGFLIFLLLYPIVGLAIKLDSPGPVLFKQRRVGMRGRMFTLYKFRSMIADAESKKSGLLARNQMDGLMFKIGDDPRITRVGRFLRKTSLDEFPQFINILKGEISLVGTRPPTPDEVQEYEDWHRRRISIKPGITGLWQISGRNGITRFYDVVNLDLEYIDRWRFRKDLAILYRTIWVVLGRKGAM